VAKLSVAIERTDSPYPNYLQSPCKLIIKSAKFPEDLEVSLCCTTDRMPEKGGYNVWPAIAQ